MSFFALLVLSGLLLASLTQASYFFKVRVDLKRFDWNGNEIRADPSLPRENPFSNENVIFRDLAGAALANEDGFDFSVLKLESTQQKQKNLAAFKETAAELISLNVCTFPERLLSFPRSCLVSNARLLVTRQRYLFEAILVDLLRVIHPSLIGLPFTVDDLLLLVVSHFVLRLDFNFYFFEFDLLKDLFVHFKELKAGTFALQLLYDGWSDELIQQVALYALENGTFFILWWLLEAGHFPWTELTSEQVKELVCLVFNQQEIKRNFVLNRIIEVYSGSFVIYDDAKPWPLLWFVGIKAANEAAGFVDSELLSSLIASSSFNWDVCDEEGLTVLGKWIYGEEIPQNLISQVLRAHLITDNLAANGVGFVGVIGSVTAESGKIQISKLKRCLTEMLKINWSTAVKEAFLSGQLWLFFSVLDDALSAQGLSQDVLCTHVLKPLAIEIESPGALCEAFEKSHQVLLASPVKSSVFNYYSNWNCRTPSPSASPPSAPSCSIESPKQSSYMFRSLNWNRSRSRSNKLPTAAVLTTKSIADNVLSSIISLLEARNFLIVNTVYEKSC